MAGELHPVGAHLAGDGHQRRAVQIGVGHAGNEVGGTGAEGGQADACPAGEPAVDIGHEGGTLLVPHRDESDVAVPDGEHQVQRLLTGDAEHHIDALRFQTVHEDLRGVFLLFLHFMRTLLSFIKKKKGSAAPLGHTAFVESIVADLARFDKSEISQKAQPRRRIFCAVRL